MKDVLRYKDFIGSVHFSAEDDCFFGKIEGIDDLVTFEGRDVDELKRSFREAVEDYIDLCRKAGKPLFKSYGGTFNIRMPAELHQKAAEVRLLGISLNQLVQRAVEKEVRESWPVAPISRSFRLLGRREGQKVYLEGKEEDMKRTVGVVLLARRSSGFGAGCKDKAGRAAEAALAEIAQAEGPGGVEARNVELVKTVIASSRKARSRSSAALRPGFQALFPVEQHDARLPGRRHGHGQDDGHGHAGPGLQASSTSSPSGTGSSCGSSFKARTGRAREGSLPSRPRSWPAPWPSSASRTASSSRRSSTATRWGSSGSSAWSSGPRRR